MTQMTQMSTSLPTRPGASAPNNIYTVLMVVAAVALLIGVIFLWRYSSKLYDTKQPFQVVDKSALR